MSLVTAQVSFQVCIQPSTVQTAGSVHAPPVLLRILWEMRCVDFAAFAMENISDRAEKTPHFCTQEQNTAA